LFVEPEPSFFFTERIKVTVEKDYEIPYLFKRSNFTEMAEYSKSLIISGDIFDAHHKSETQIKMLDDLYLNLMRTTV